MVMVTSASAIPNVDLREGGSGNETSNRERAKKTRSGGSYEIERTKLKISTMTSVEDLEESISVLTFLFVLVSFTFI